MSSKKNNDVAPIFNSASDMRAYLASLIARHEAGDITDEDYDRRHNALRTMAKVHGDVVREKAVVVAAKAQGIGTAELPSFFEKTRPALKAAG